MRRAPCRAALLLSLGSCAAEPVPDDSRCSDAVVRMRTELRLAYDAAEPPKGVADWVAPLYRDFRRSTDPTRRAALLDEGVGRAIAGCYGLSDAFRGAAEAPSGSRRAAMAKLVPDALASCRCRGVDVGSLGFLLRLTPAP
jgi:hypothetical protein